MPTGAAAPVIDRVAAIFLAYAIGSRLMQRATAAPSTSAVAPAVPSNLTSLSLGTFAFVYAATGDWMAAATTSAPMVARAHHIRLNVPCCDASRHGDAPSADRTAVSPVIVSESASSRWAASVAAMIKTTAPTNSKRTSTV